MSEAGRRIREMRQEQGRSLTWLAGRADISKSFLCDIEKGRKGMGAEVLLNLALALGTSPDAIMAPDIEGKPSAAVSVPSELARLAETRGLPWRAVLALLGVWRVIESYRRAKRPPDWPLLWERLKAFIVDDGEAA